MIWVYLESNFVLRIMFRSLTINISFDIISKAIAELKNICGVVIGN